MHHSSAPSTPTNTGAARMMTSTYRSWICWPWTVAPCLAQPVSNVPARAASPTRETLEAAIRIGRSGDRELEGHADGGVHRRLVHGQPGRAGRLPLRLALAAPSQRQRHHRDQKHAEPPGTWPPPVLSWLPAHRDLLAAGPPLSWYGYARRHARH